MVLSSVRKAMVSACILPPPLDPSTDSLTSRDENGFKCHTQSESHVRQMLVVGENAKQHVDNYSNQFKHDFLQLLRTSHGEKKINANHFYQEYIANKEHIHMNATRWISLSEFVKYLGREGQCRVEEGEKGFFISWVDSSPEALQRQAAIKKKERQDRGDEEREQRAIQEQIERARRDAEASGKLRGEISEQEKLLQREGEGEKIKLDFGAKTPLPTAGKNTAEAPEAKKGAAEEVAAKSTAGGSSKLSIAAPAKIPKNVFAKKKPLEAKKDGITKAAPARPMSEAERIMKLELERKRIRGGPDNNDLFKRQRVA